MNNFRNKAILPPQQMITRAELKKEITEGKTKVILNIIGYCMLLLGSMGIYILLFLDKISMGKINISEKNLKKITAIILVFIWSIFLAADCIKLNSMNNE